MSINGYQVIDAHAHITPIHLIKPAQLAEWRKTYGAKLDEIREMFEDPGKVLAHLDREGIDKVVCINYLSPDLFGFNDSVHDYVVKLCSHAPDRLLSCGGVDPVNSSDLQRDAEDLILRRKIRLIKIHGPHSGFAPDDYLRDKPGLAKVYALAEQHGVPVMFHTGTSIFPGARSKYGHPMAVDDIAIDFPKLKIIMAHGGRPLWMTEAFFLMRRHANVHMDISGIPPKLLLTYFPRVEEIANKTLFGTDWPSPGIPGQRVNAEAIIALPISEESKRKILYENADRLLFASSREAATSK
jgi:predicted TIM-barrel fold metal-dependent hydrolase